MQRFSVFACSAFLGLFSCQLQAQPASQSGFTYCQVQDVSASKTFWASQSFKFDYLKDQPHGSFIRMNELASEFHTHVGSLGGTGDKSCNGPFASLAQADAARNESYAIITKKFMGVFGITWKDIAWTPKPWNPASTASQATKQQHFYCYATDMESDVRTSVASLVFQRNVPGDTPMAPYNQAEAYQTEFKQNVMGANGVVNAFPQCLFFDTLAEAEKSRADYRDTFSGFNLTFNDVAWQPSSLATATATAPSTAPTSAAAQPSSSQPGQLGIKIDALTASMAQALGLQQAQGVLVVETLAGSNAAKGGLQALDVIVEVAGQSTAQPADLQAIIRNMRPGYRAALRVWRNRSMVDLTVEISASKPASTL